MSAIATVNAGSSTVKLALFNADRLKPLERVTLRTPQEAIAWLQARKDAHITAFSHRVVHGGRMFTQPVRIDDAVMKQLEALIPLAPLHQPAHLSLIAQLQQAFSHAAHIACFDTAFHHTLPELERMLPLPQQWRVQGLERYGFHGLSYQYIASQLPAVLGVAASGRVVVAHLGNGASVCGLANGVSRATSMGFSTLDGLMMGTRCGSLDPGVVLHLQQQCGLSADEVSQLLYKNSGLKGVSGISADMRELSASSSKEARIAIELFCLSAAKQIAQTATTIGGMDTLVFTAGIGENAANVRALICAHLAWLGIAVDVAANDTHAQTISAQQSRIGVYVIPTDEESVLAEGALL